MSLLLDALKQAERNKAQAEETAMPGADPKIRLENIDLDLREPSAEKVEPYVAAGSTARSTVARAMQEPALRSAAARQAEEQEVERQSAKQLFAAKQAVRKPSLGGTWIAGIAVAALAVASALVYFWTVKRGEPTAASGSSAAAVANLPVPSSTPALPQPQATPASAAGDTAAQLSAQPSSLAVEPQAAETVSIPTDTSADGFGASQSAQQSTLAHTAESAAPAGAHVPDASSLPDAKANPAESAATSAGAEPQPSAAEPPTAASGVAADDDADQEPVAIAAAPAGKKVTRSRQAPARNAPPAADTWAVQQEQAEAENDAAVRALPDKPGKAKRARNQNSGDESSMSVQRSAAVIELHPDLAAAYQALISGNAAVAAQRYRAVLNSDAFNVDAELGLATIAASQGDRESARSHYRRALELDPKNDVALAGLASVAGASGASSESGLKTQLAEQPTSHPLHFALGNDFARQQRWPEAQQAYFNAYSLDPDNPDYAYNLAVSLDHLNQPRAALNYYERAKQLSEARSAQFNRAQLERRISELKLP